MNAAPKRDQCIRTVSQSVSYFLVRNGYFEEMISPSKKVVNVGYSSVKPGEADDRKD